VLQIQPFDGLSPHEASPDPLAVDLRADARVVETLGGALRIDDAARTLRLVLPQAPTAP
jgi:hypothetical protein